MKKFRWRKRKVVEVGDDGGDERKEEEGEEVGEGGLYDLTWEEGAGKALKKSRKWWWWWWWWCVVVLVAAVH